MQISLVLLFTLFFLTPVWAADAVPATAYFPVLPFEAPAEQAPQLVPVAANHPMDGDHQDINQAVIVIHDDSRDANEALGGMAALAGAANSTTLILAPQFLLASDITRFADHLPEKGRAFAVWERNGWPQGDDAAATPGHQAVSSFTVLDLLLMYLSDRAAFPHLKHITLAGFGTGAIFVQRYAAFGMATSVVTNEDIEMRYVVAGATSYLYLTAARPLGGHKGFGRPDLTACPGSNSYPYGLDMLNPYARRVGANAAKTDYPLRFVTYLNGSAPSAAPDTACAALDQGVDSATRAANYQSYLQSLYGDLTTRTQTFWTAKNKTDDAMSLFGSSCGMAVLFGDGLCPHLTGDAP